MLWDGDILNCELVLVTDISMALSFIVPSKGKGTDWIRLFFPESDDSVSADLGTHFCINSKIMN